MQDFARLSAGPGKLAFDDYVTLGLFDPGRYAGVDRTAFVGRKVNSELINAINHRREWHGVAGDKVAAAAYLGAHGFPTLLARRVYARGLQRGERLVGSLAALLAWLRDARHYPLFGKPVDGDQSLGSIALAALDPDGATARRPNGEPADLERLVAEIDRHYPGGYLFQPLARPAPEIGAFTAGALATVRVLTALMDGEPRLLSACLKLPTGGNHADNYWRTGNVLCGLDARAGAVIAATRGVGPALAPVTEAEAPGLLGLHVPGWTELVATALDGQSLMRGLPLLGWDIAPTPDGPVVIEMNWTPSVFLNQLADRRGALTPELRALAAAETRAEQAARRAAKADYLRFVGYR
jgi:hypothetical protein